MWEEDGGRQEDSWASSSVMLEDLSGTGRCHPERQEGLLPPAEELLLDVKEELLEEKESTTPTTESLNEVKEEYPEEDFIFPLDVKLEEYKEEFKVTDVLVDHDTSVEDPSRDLPISLGGVKGIKREEEEKPHPCLECEAKFSRKYNLTKHLRTHTGEKP